LKRARVLLIAVALAIPVADAGACNSGPEPQAYLRALQQRVLAALAESESCLANELLQARFSLESQEH
jgi:hypothetical protein